MKRVPMAILCVGLAAVAAYLNINHQDAWWVWCGSVLAFFGTGA